MLRVPNVWIVTLAVAVSASAGRIGLGAQGQTSLRKVYVSAADKDGAPVADLAAADLEIKAAGKTQTVVGVARATTPFKVALLDADGGTGTFQLGIAHFVQKLLERARFQFMSIIVQPERIGGYSGDPNTVLASLKKLGVRGNAGGGAQLMEAILDATKDIKSEIERSVIVVMRMGGESASDISAKLLRAELQKSGAILFVVSTTDANRQPTSQAPTTPSTDTMAQARAQFADAEAADKTINLATILGDGSRESGGRHEQVVTTTMVKTLEGMADELLNQYEVTYTVPDGFKPTDKLSVASKRKGLTVRAPSR